MDSGTLIAEVARRDGVLLDKGDPVLVVATALDVVMSEHRAALAAAAQPIPDGVLRQAVIQGIAVHARSLVRALNIRTELARAGVVVVLMIAAFASGYFWHDSRQLVAGVSAGQQECHEQQGGTICYIPVWAKLPPQ